MPCDFKARGQQLNGILATEDNLNKYNQLKHLYAAIKQDLIGEAATSQIQRKIAYEMKELNHRLPGLTNSEQTPAQANATELTPRRLVF